MEYVNQFIILIYGTFRLLCDIAFFNYIIRSLFKDKKRFLIPSSLFFYYTRINRVLSLCYNLLLLSLLFLDVVVFKFIYYELYLENLLTVFSFYMI